MYIIGPIIRISMPVAIQPTIPPTISIALFIIFCPINGNSPQSAFPKSCLYKLYDPTYSSFYKACVAMDLLISTDVARLIDQSTYNQYFPNSQIIIFKIIPFARNIVRYAPNILEAFQKRHTLLVDCKRQ